MADRYYYSFIPSSFTVKEMVAYISRIDRYNISDIDVVATNCIQRRYTSLFIHVFILIL